MRIRQPALRVLATAGAVLLLASCAGPGAPPTPAAGAMGFFVTSVSPGKGGDLGGLAGADAHCQRLAAAVGAGNRSWRAYLSVPGSFASPAAPGVASVHARERIGKGPWTNATGVLVARDLAHLHDGNAIDKSTALNEKGEAIGGRGDRVLEHDILTGSRPDGTAFGPHGDTSCRGWTSSGDGSAIVGHHDRSGPMPDAWARSWNSSHPSAGCSTEALRGTGGAGLYYCFAAD